MRKTAALLILLLIISGAVFAGYGVDGSVKNEFSFRSGNIGYSVEWNKSASFNISTESVVISLSSKKESVSELELNRLRFKSNLGTLKYVITLNIGSEEIKVKDSSLTGKDWSVDLVNGAMNGDYAKSHWDYVYDEIAEQYSTMTYNNTVGKKKKMDGLTFKYKNTTASIGVEQTRNNTYTLNFGFQSPTIEFGDFSTRAALISGVKKGGSPEAYNATSVSVKAGYKNNSLNIRTAFDARYDEDFLYDFETSLSYEPVCLDLYYAKKIPAKRIYLPVLENYMSARIHMETDAFSAYAGMKDLLDRNKMKSLCIGARYIGGFFELGSSAIYNFSEELLVICADVLFYDLLPGFSVNASANCWKSGEKSIFSAGAGAKYVSNSFEIRSEAVFASENGAVSAGFKGALIVSSIIQGLSLECSVQINAGALQLYSTAKENSSYCCDARPESYLGNTSGVTVSCIYSF